MARVFADLPGLEPDGPPSLRFVDSFRGRRGWHVVFHCHARVAGEPGGDLPSAWHPADDLPWTAHRPWEQQSVTRALAAD